MAKRKNGCPRCGGPNTLVSGFIVCGRCGHRRGEQQLSDDWASEGGDLLLFMHSEPHTVPPPRSGDWRSKEFSTDPHKLLDEENNR
jgi:hypothetical protein